MSDNEIFLISSDLSLIYHKVKIQVHSFLGTVSSMSDRSCSSIFIPSASYNALAHACLQGAKKFQ